MPISTAKLIKARGKMDLGQAAFAIGQCFGRTIFRQSVHQWEKGSSVPDANRLEAIAAAYNVKMQDLFEPANGRKKQ